MPCSWLSSRYCFGVLIFRTLLLPMVIQVAKNSRGSLFCPQESFHEGGDRVCPVLGLHFPQLKHTPVVGTGSARPRAVPTVPGAAHCVLGSSGGRSCAPWEEVHFVSLAGVSAVPQAETPLCCTRVHMYERAHTCIQLSPQPPDWPERLGESGHSRSATTKSICICLDGIFLWKYGALVGIWNPSSLAIKHP